MNVFSEVWPKNGPFSSDRPFSVSDSLVNKTMGFFGRPKEDSWDPTKKSLPSPTPPQDGPWMNGKPRKMLQNAGNVNESRMFFFRRLWVAWKFDDLVSIEKISELQKVSAESTWRMAPHLVRWNLGDLLSMVNGMILKHGSVQYPPSKETFNNFPPKLPYLEHQNETYLVKNIWLGSFLDVQGRAFNNPFGFQKIDPLRCWVSTLLGPSKVACWKSRYPLKINQQFSEKKQLTPKKNKSALPRPNIFYRNTHFLNHGHLSKLHHISTNNKTIHRSTTIPWTFDEGSTVSYSWNIPVDISFGRVVPWILGGVLIEEMFFWTPGNV